MELWSSLGGAGIGLVWGWLAGRLGIPIAHPVRTGLAVLASTVVSAFVLCSLAGMLATLTFSAAALVSAAFHYSWRCRLAAQHDGSDTERGLTNA